MISNQIQPIETIITESINDKIDIETANISKCYDLIKHLSLKRYRLSDYIHSSEYTTDRNVLGWLNDDIQNVLPKSIKRSECICNSKNINITNDLGKVESKIISYDRVVNHTILDKDQIYAHMYGALQKVIQDKEALEEKVASQQRTIDALLAWATQQGFQVAP